MVNPIVLRVGCMDMEGNTKDIAENRTYVLELEKRLANVESGLQNISRGFQSGNLAPEQEVRVATVEERLENVEDLQMVANLDLIKINDFIEKIPAVEKQPTFFAGTNAPDLERRVNDVESALKRIEDMNSRAEIRKVVEEQPAGNMRNIQEIGNLIKQDAQEIRNETKQNIQEIRSDVIRMKAEFSSFKGETEEAIKVIISSIKRMSEVLK